MRKIKWLKFWKSIKGDRFCFLVESGSGQGLMIHKIWSYTEENWLCYQTDYVHRSLIRVCLVSLGSMDQRPHCSSYVCKASSSGTQGRFQIDNCPLVVLLLIWNLFSVMLFRILNQLQSTVRNYSMKCFSKWTNSTICHIWLQWISKTKILNKMIPLFGQKMILQWWFTPQEQQGDRKELYTLLNHWQQWFKCFILDGIIVRIRNLWTSSVDFVRH